MVLTFQGIGEPNDSNGQDCDRIGSGVTRYLLPLANCRRSNSRIKGAVRCRRRIPAGIPVVVLVSGDGFVSEAWLGTALARV